MVDVFTLALRFVLAAVFAVAAVAKLRDKEGTAEALEGFGVPEPMVPSATYLLPTAEAAAAVLLVLPGTYVVGALWSLVLLIGFTAAIGINLARGSRPACRCFGEMSAKPIGPRTIARNLALSAVAISISLAAPSTWTTAQAWFESMSPEVAKLSLGVGLLGLVVGLQSWFLARLWDQNSALSTRLEALDSVGKPQGLEPGSEAPRFSLPTADGTKVGVDDLLARGKPVVLTFTDPHCGPCQALVPQIAMWQKSLANVFTIGVVSRGKMSDNTEHAKEHGLVEVMVQKRDEVSEAYGVRGTPNAVRISADGEIESHVAQGVEEITALFEGLISEHAQSLWEEATGSEIPRPYTGLPLGTEPPDMVVHDLDGHQHRLPDLLARPTMLVFWSPRCSFCHQIAGDLRALEARLPENRQLVFATIGTAEENRFMALRSTMLFDPEFDIGGFFHAQGTPAALLLNEGKVASPLESGTEEVLSLATHFVGSGPRKVETPAFRKGD